MNDSAPSGVPNDGQKPDKSGGQSLPFFKAEGHPSPLSVGDMNAVVREINKLLSLSVSIVPAETDQDGNSVSTGRLILAGLNAVLELKLGTVLGGGGGGAAGIVAMKVVSWTPGVDYLMADLYNFGSGATSTSLKVALPWLLRIAQTPGGSTPQIWPAYAANDIIIALDNPDFGTGVSDANYLAIQDRNWAQYISYTDASCNPKHRIMVGGPEVDGA